MKISLRKVEQSDLPVFFEQVQDEDARHMAAFTYSTDKDKHDAHWQRILARPDVTARTIIVDGKIAGQISSFKEDGRMEVSYWIDKAYWGQGIATKALADLLGEVSIRPIFARAAKDNKGSLRVLEKNGFVITGEDKGFAQARNAEVDEYVLELKKPTPVKPKL